MEPVNLQVLWASADGDLNFAGELAALYLQQISEQLGLLRTALDERSAPAVEHIAHRCKGGSMACGVVTLGLLFKRLEQLGRNGSLAEAERVSGEIDEEFSRVQVVLRALAPTEQNPGMHP